MINYLHRRAGFGATWSQLQRDLQEGPEASVNRLLAGESQSDGRSDSFQPMAEVIGNAATTSNDPTRLKAWWIYRMLFSPDPLREKLTLLWHNHFATSNQKVDSVWLMRKQNELFRTHAQSKFRELLSQALRDPALLIWLDADSNRKGRPNENLARELLELFSLGVGNYTERDVKETARALTGWSVYEKKFYNDERHHDDGEKTILGKTGRWTGDDLVPLLVEQPATAKRIALRMCDLFMGEGCVSDEHLNELAAGLRDHELDVGWAVETVLRSEAFFSETNLRNRVLSPIEFIVGAVRHLEMTDSPPSTLLLAEASANIGQDLFYPPNVFGWPGGRSWLSSRALIARANTASALIAGDLHSSQRPFDAAELAHSHGFRTGRDIASFYAQLLLGQKDLPAEFHSYVDTPDRLVTAVLASPYAQLG